MTKARIVLLSQYRTPEQIVRRAPYDPIPDFTTYETRRSYVRVVVWGCVCGAVLLIGATMGFAT